MTQLKLLSPEIAQQSISQREIVLPLNAAIEAVDYCALNQLHILGWEGWIQTPDRRVGHGNAPQGTVSLEGLSITDAAETCRNTIRAAAQEWSENNPGTTDRLHFCITINSNGIPT
ncbi:hypothetical protein [Paraburkholderia sediminicola]|uniref:hypothetical protein n=1 Tax=Paraburkholderia sediminicola TaxID=458836 RepID=UPI0038BBA982